MDSFDDKIDSTQVYQADQFSRVPPQPKVPPPPPPRSITNSVSSLLEPLRPNGRGQLSNHTVRSDPSWLSQDPRSSSTQSLVPIEKSNGKRILLLIYLHGFLGSETSFSSFPAHVHNLISVAVTKTHIVHTKIYPRYRSRKAIEHARDEFSNWLCPNESADTDVILLGHSMGGILSAEIALLPSILSSRSSAQGFRHCILGTMSFDCPFLGMHPGIVFSGIESLFRSAPTSPEISKSYPYQAWGSSQNDRSQATSPSMATLNLSSSGLESYPNSSASLIGSESQAAEAFEGNKSQESIRADSYSWSPDPDPNYNPPFPNDIRLPQRKGWDNALHFLTKHSQDLTHAAKAYVTSHLEFGVCVADYKGLKNRYTNLRPLEEANSPHNHGRRIRFVNYYTTCTGRPKRLKPVSRNEVGPYSYLGDARLSSGQTPRHHLDNMQNLGVHVPTTEPYNSGPRISVEEYRDGEMHSRETEDADATKPSREATSNVEERNVTSEVDSAGNSTDRSASIQSLLEPLSDVEPSVSNPAEIDPGRPLPQLPDFPGQPPRYDPASFFDGGSRNLAHKQYSADFKAYMRVLKAYDKAINNRQHLLEKQDKFKDKTKKRSKFQETTKASPSTVSTTSSKNAESVATSIISAKSPEEESLHALSETPCEKTKKERRFCVLPPQINGQTDPCWVQVFMKDVDQVGAHCGLFVPGDHYGWLVKDVVARIKAWVEEK